MFGINLKAVSSGNVSRRSNRWRLSSVADADAMGAVAVAHKGIVESVITWSPQTSNLANLFRDSAQVVLSLATGINLYNCNSAIMPKFWCIIVFIFSPSSSLFRSGGVDKQRIMSQSHCD